MKNIIFYYHHSTQLGHCEVFKKKLLQKGMPYHSFSTLRNNKPIFVISLENVGLLLKFKKKKIISYKNVTPN